MYPLFTYTHIFNSQLLILRGYYEEKKIVKKKIAFNEL